MQLFTISNEQIFLDMFHYKVGKRLKIVHFYWNLEFEWKKYGSGLILLLKFSMKSNFGGGNAKNYEVL